MIARLDELERVRADLPSRRRSRAFARADGIARPAPPVTALICSFLGLTICRFLAGCCVASACSEYAREATTAVACADKCAAVAVLWGGGCGIFFDSSTLRCGD